MPACIDRPASAWTCISSNWDTCFNRHVAGLTISSHTNNQTPPYRPIRLRKTISAQQNLEGLPLRHKKATLLQDVQKDQRSSTRPIPAATSPVRPESAKTDSSSLDTPCPRQGHRRVKTGGLPSGAHGAMNKEHQVCARRRVGEAAGSPVRILTNRERRWRAFSASC